MRPPRIITPIIMQSNKSAQAERRTHKQLTRRLARQSFTCALCFVFILLPRFRHRIVYYVHTLKPRNEKYKIKCETRVNALLLSRFELVTLHAAPPPPPFFAIVLRSTYPMLAVCRSILSSSSTSRVAASGLVCMCVCVCDDSTYVIYWTHQCEMCETI